MAYLEDNDLAFLANVESNDLERLFYVLTRDLKDGKPLAAQELLSKAPFKAACPDYKQHWQLLAEELQRFGANSVATLLRLGKGVAYREILEDVCGELSIEFKKSDTTRIVETNLLVGTLKKYWNKMLPAHQKQYLSSLTGSTEHPGLNNIITRLSKAGPDAAEIAESIMGMEIVSLGPEGGRGGFPFSPLQVAAFVVLPPFALYTMLSSAFTAYGPGANFNVTIPACLIIAALRKKYDLPIEYIIVMEKYEIILRAHQQRIAEYQRSDEKLFRLYTVGQYSAQHINANISDDDIAEIIFPIDHMVKIRVLAQYGNTSSSIQSFEEALSAAMENDLCSKLELQEVCEAILAYATPANQEEAQKEPEANLRYAP